MPKSDSTAHGPTSLARRAIVFVSWFVLVVSILVVVVQSWEHRSSAVEVELLSLERAKRNATEAVEQIDERLRIVPNIANGLADDLTSGNLALEEVNAKLKELAHQNPLVNEIGIAFEPRISGRLHAPFVRRLPNGANEFGELDYNYIGHDWYLDPILDGARWVEPYLEVGSRTRLAEFGVPFRLPQDDKSTPSGVVYLNLSIDDLQQDLASLGLGRRGHAYVFSNDGRYVIHPRESLVAERRTIFETAWLANDPDLHTMAIRAVGGETGVLERVDELTGLSSWTLYQQVPTTAWTLAIVVVREEMWQAPDQMRIRLLIILIASLLAITSLGLLGLLLWVGGHPMAPWAGVWLVSLVLTIGISGTWIISTQVPRATIFEEDRVVDHGAMQAQLRDQVQSADGTGLKEPLQLQTGVFVKSVEFASGNNVTVSGRIWQKFDQQLLDDLQSEFDPRAPELEPKFELSEAVSIELAKGEVQKNEDGYLGIWPFVATLRQSFSYEQYPFDRQEIWLRLRYPEAGLNAVLVPDLGSYTVTNPASKPGVKGDLVLPGWTVENAYFNFHNHEYNTTFGSEALRLSRGWPELQFNIEVRRQFIGPLISSFVPWAVALAMIYGILLVASSSAERSSRFGFTALDALLGCAALFFVLSFEHVALREAIPSPRVMYFEYFYFTAYIALMGVSLNAILLPSGRAPAFLLHKENILPKLLFWPASLFLLFMITLKVCW